MKVYADMQYCAINNCIWAKIAVLWWNILFSAPYRLAGVEQHRFNVPSLPLVILYTATLDKSRDVSSSPLPPVREAYLLFSVVVPQDVQWQVVFSDEGNTTALEGDSVRCEAQLITSECLSLVFSNKYLILENISKD